MDVKQFTGMLKEHYEKLAPEMQSRRKVCSDTLKDLRKLEKEKKGADASIKERAALTLRIERLKYHAAMYNVPVTKIMPLRVVLMKSNGRKEEYYYNGKLLAAFIARLGNRFKWIDLYIEPKTLRLHVDYKTTYSKGTLQLNQMTIYGSGFTEFETLIPTLQIIQGKSVTLEHRKVVKR